MKSPSHAAVAIAARKQSNLAFALRFLEPRRRRAMEVFYDFCRRIDDIADELPDENLKRSQLGWWRAAVQRMFECQALDLPVGSEQIVGAGDVALARELDGVFRDFRIPERLPLAIVDGVCQDLGNRRYETFEELRGYCYGVASAVGLVSVRIFGCRHVDTDAFAETLGYALQFTNILRDVAEDYVTMGRVYLPQAELRAFGVSEEELANPAGNPRCERLLRLCAFRCRHFFNRARRLLPVDERSNLRAALVMGAFYEAILDKIEASGFAITPKRMRLSRFEKFRLLLRTLRSAESRAIEPPVRPGRVCVFGGGVSGISAALEAGLEGFTPSLIEARSRLGGRAHSFVDPKWGVELDNGQHIVMGCYRSFLRLVDVLGKRDSLEFAPRLDVPYICEGRESRLEALDGPAPLHALGALVRFDELDWRDRSAILRFAVVLRTGEIPRKGETAFEWLRRNGQTEGAIRALWEPFCVAALNEPVAEACAALLRETLLRSLFGGPLDAAIICASNGFSHLFEPEVELFLRSIGGELRMGSRIAALITDPGAARVVSVELSDGERLAADWFVSALPWTALENLLPDEASALRQRLSKIPSSAIISVHLLLSKTLFENDAGFCGLLDSPVHWVFDRSSTLPESLAGKRLYSVVVSAAGDWLQWSASDIEQEVLAELQRHFKVSGAMIPEHSWVFKWRQATFSSRPGIESVRPLATGAPWTNFRLAGDWVQTGLPATLESAAESGFKAIRSFNRNRFGELAGSRSPAVTEVSLAAVTG